MHTNHPHHSDDLRRCIQLCSDCAATCTETAIHCLSMGPDHTARAHQTLLQDCADICLTAVRFMARTSPHHSHICRECAEICHQCATECEAMAEGDHQMLDCARLCHACAQACEHMAPTHA